MQDILRDHPEDKRRTRSWLFALLLVWYVATMMIMGNSGEVDEQMIIQADPVMLLGLQGIFSAFMFIGAAMLFIAVALKIPFKEFFPRISISALNLTLVIAFSFMVVNSAVGEWNMNLDFPDSAFQEWARQSEDQLKVLTDHLINFTSPAHFTIAFLVIGVIPSIGEELIFRGLIQNLFSKAFGNPHVAIWLGAFIFGAIHMQFYGVIPRMLLGVVFGYLYHWSGKLTVAMIAHLVNNGVALILVYLSQLELINVSQEQMESSAPWPAILVFSLIFFVTVRVFHKKFSPSSE